MLWKYVKSPLSMAISLGVTKCETKKRRGIGVWARSKPFDREYLENGKSERYM